MPSQGEANWAEVFLTGGMLIAAIGVFLAIAAVLSYLNHLLIMRVPEAHRQIRPSAVWFLMVPVFNVIWNFVVFLQVPESYQRWLGRDEAGDAGRKLGLWFAVTAAAAGVPYLGCAAGPAALILAVLYFVKLFGLQRPAPVVTNPPENR